MKLAYLGDALDHWKARYLSSWKARGSCVTSRSIRWRLTGPYGRRTTTSFSHVSCASPMLRYWATDGHSRGALSISLRSSTRATYS